MDTWICSCSLWHLSPPQVNIDSRIISIAWSRQRLGKIMRWQYNVSVVLHLLKLYGEGYPERFKSNKNHTMRPLTLISYKTRITARARIKPEKTYATSYLTVRERSEEMELGQCGNLTNRWGKRHCKIMWGNEAISNTRHEAWELKMIPLLLSQVCASVKARAEREGERQRIKVR